MAVNRNLAPARRRYLLAAWTVVFVGLTGTSAGAHAPPTQGTTTISPTSGGRGSTVTGSGQGANVETGAPYSLMFADRAQVESFGQSGQGHENACAHGSPISEPVQAKADGDIPETSSYIPPFASEGKALLCFTNGSHVTTPVEFTVG